MRMSSGVRVAGFIAVSPAGASRHLLRSLLSCSPAAPRSVARPLVGRPRCLLVCSAVSPPRVLGLSTMDTVDGPAPLSPLSPLAPLGSREATGRTCSGIPISAFPSEQSAMSLFFEVIPQRLDVDVVLLALLAESDLCDCSLHFGRQVKHHAGLGDRLPRLALPSDVLCCCHWLLPISASAIEPV